MFIRRKLKSLENIVRTEEVRYYFVALLLLFFIALVFGFVSAELLPESNQDIAEKISEALEPFAEFSLSELFVFILVNNVVTTLGAMLFGIFFGIIPVLIVLINGYVIGALASVLAPNIDIFVLLAGTIPHGIIEIPAALLASSYGIFLGEKFMRKLKTRQYIKPHLRTATAGYWLVVFPLLIISAFIEVFVTSSILEALVLK